jgi:malonyl-CoA/methylmalonyl-CoA synthetase
VDGKVREASVIGRFFWAAQPYSSGLSFSSSKSLLPVLLLLLHQFSPTLKTEANLTMNDLARELQVVDKAFRSHKGATVLPNFPLFGRLLRHAHCSHIKTAIRDAASGFSSSYAQLLTDILSLRNVLLQSLGLETLERLENGEEVYIGLLTPGGYEFSVPFFAILAAGGIVVPISPHAPPQELLYFLKTSRAYGLLSSSSTKLPSNLKASLDRNFFSLNIAPHIYNAHLAPTDIFISAAESLDCRQPGLAIFSSGTTGPPKAAVLPRDILSSGTQSICDHFEITSSEVAMHCLPVHHAAGILISFLPFLLAGACVEFHSGSFKADQVWEQWRTGGLTAFTGVPTIYSRMMRYYEDVLQTLPPSEQAQYLSGAQGFRILMCGTSALPQPLQMKWSKLTGGRRILERYGTTEFSSIFLTPCRDNDHVPDGSVGVILPGVEIKLSNGNEGEILVKAPAMFSRYLGQPAATRDAHDSEGFYKTGDIGRREGPYYYILGRVSTNIIKSGGYKISALDIEREILSLDYISEVAVVGVEDEEFGQRVAAAIILRELRELSVDELRKELRKRLAGYKLPTMLFVAEDLPKTATGKIQKKIVKAKIFEAKPRVEGVQVWYPPAKKTKGVVQARL